MNRQVIPWIMVMALSVFVFALSWQAKHANPPDPTYDFYDTAYVKVDIHGSEGIHDLFGRYNHILHGQRVLIKANELERGTYLLAFPVFSPRPAVLYVDDEALEIFLQPGDTSLHVDLWYNPAAFAFDSIEFSGAMALVCEYYLSKSQQFNRVHIRGLRNTIESANFGMFSRRLDSLAAWELGMLAEKQVVSRLPEWFVAFERNDILYQKAYLKLSQSLNREIDSSLLDALPLDNQEAEFSYYYYLYLHTWFADPSVVLTNLDSLAYVREIGRQLELADSVLSQSPHDVFFTRIIFALIHTGKLEEADFMLRKFGQAFESKIYFRYLQKHLKDAYLASTSVI